MMIGAPNGMSMGSGVQRYGSKDLGPVSLKFEMLIIQIQWKLCIYTEINHLVMTKLCTWHDSIAVMPCAKFCHDRLTAIMLCIFMKFE